MNLLDENILESQRQLLRSWRIPTRQIGQDVGRKGMKDEEIISFLLQLRRSTFFTLDSGFYEHSLCHPKYCLVCLDVKKQEAATFVRRVLRHPAFDTTAKRMGAVMRASVVGIVMWRLLAANEASLAWED